MKKIFANSKFIKLCLILLTCFAVSCTKSDKVVAAKPATIYENTATIIGQDMALCACCGDWKIIIDNMVYPANVPLPFVHQFKFLPASSNIDLSTATFPLLVKISWSVDVNTCGGNNGRIIIDDIALN